MSCGGGAPLRQTVHSDCGLLCQEVGEAESGEDYTTLSPHLRAIQSPPSSIPWRMVIRIIQLPPGHAAVS